MKKAYKRVHVRPNGMLEEMPQFHNVFVVNLLYTSPKTRQKKHSKMLFVDSAHNSTNGIDFKFMKSFDVKYVLLIACISANVFDDVQMLKNLETLERASDIFMVNTGAKIRRVGRENDLNCVLDEEIKCSDELESQCLLKNNHYLPPLNGGKRSARNLSVHFASESSDGE